MDQKQFPNVNSIFETREELIVSPLQPNSDPCLRNAHFLKPNVRIPTNPPPIIQTQNEDQHLPIQLPGWRNPQVNYKKWVVLMSAKYRSVWEKAGIYDAIISSTYKINKLDDLVVGFVRNWCPETKSFVFEWGECSFTLEDVHVLGGYSFFGDSVLSPVENEYDSLQAMDSLMNVRRELNKSSAKRVDQHKWMKMFMNVDHWYEHEGFLAYWLAMFVFPHSYDCIGKHVIPIAVNLARGRKIALAPAVLASIYRDLTLISRMKQGSGVKSVAVWAPFQLVQVWIWERYVHLRPKLYTLKPVEPRMARWVVDEKSEVVDNANLRNLDWNSFGNEFQWQPYASEVNNNIVFGKFYGSRTDGGRNNDELQSFARCLRPCELVGIDCIEQYLPHRVSMQFGFDQAIPSDVKRSNGTPQVAWESYSKFVDVSNLFIPSTDVIPGVTSSYVKWRKQIFKSVQSHGSKDKFKRAAKADGLAVLPTPERKKMLKQRRLEDFDYGSEMLRNHKKLSKKMPRKEDANSVPEAPPGFERSTIKRNKVGESAKSRLSTMTGQNLSDAIDDNLPLAAFYIEGKRFKHKGLPDDSSKEYHISDVLLSKKKHQLSTVILNNSNITSIMSGTHPQGSSGIDNLDKDIPRVELDQSLDAAQLPMLEVINEKEKCRRENSPVIILDIPSESASDSQTVTNVQETKMNELEEDDSSKYVDNHIPNSLADFNKNEEGLNQQQCSSKESKVAVDISSKAQDFESHEKKVKPWITVEQRIELIARQVNFLKAAARARGHHIP